MRYISQARFEQLKRYFNLSPKFETLPREEWIDKIEPIASRVQERFQKHMVPASNISVDEMMIRFTGKSIHTIKMPSKPIPEGYKVLAMAEHGYTYSFIFTSRICSFSGLMSYYTGPLSLSPTVLQLLIPLPFRIHRFILYCNNYFSNFPLFEALREFGIGACGTARPNSAGHPRVLAQIDKKKSRLPWNTLSGALSPQGNVLAVVWHDKNLVRFLTSVHQTTPEQRNFVFRERKRPPINPENRQFVTQGWGDESVKKTPPHAAPPISYNDHMGGVDIADQRRSYYSTQLTVCRNWLAIFFWLLDTVIINSFIMVEELIPHPSNPDLHWKHHAHFRTRLAWNLVQEGFREINPTYAPSLETSTQVQQPSFKLKPTGNNQFCPGARPTGNNSQSRFEAMWGRTMSSLIAASLLYITLLDKRL